MKIKKSHSKKKQHFSNDEGSVAKLTKALGIGIVSALLSMIILVLFLSFVALLFSDPNKVILPFAAVATVISSAAGGFVATRRNSSSALICGLTVGAVLLAVHLFCSFVFKADTQSASLFDMLFFKTSVPISSICGAYFGLRQPSKKSHRR